MEWMVIMEDELGIIEKYLLKEEKILWSGKSDIKKLFTVKDIYLIPLTSVFFIGALVYELVAISMIIDPTGCGQKDASSSLGKFLALVGILFMILTFYAAIGRFVVKNLIKRIQFTQ